ncbi:MAG: hypothetical protein HDR17_16515 [Lachnospiraceae bacterium]|nr:hypothetical protein [Lachnospiraceae bacterium]
MRGRLFKKKAVVLVLIFSMALTMLGACGSGVEETVSNMESDEISESASVEENIESEELEADTGIEDTEADSISEEHSEEEEIWENRVSVTGQGSLVDIAWKDYYDEVYETIIHFSFSDGTIVDHKLEGWSIVKNIEYKDITGDGTDEVIIYSEILNNIHDDYIIINFFKIEDDTVTEISPSTDIPELSGEMEIISDPSEEYTIVLRMESYGKTAGVLYTDTIVTVGYNKERWEIIQKHERPEWKAAYLDYLIRDIVDTGSCRYWLVCVDEDDVPELLYCVDDAQDAVSVLTYKDGEVKELGDEKGTGEYENGMKFDELWGILGSPEEG